MSLDDVLKAFTLYEPADEAAIEAAQERVGVRFPADYVEFLRRSNGATLDEPLVALGSTKGVCLYDELTPSQAGKVTIGSDSGSCYFGFDVSRDPPVYLAMGVEDYDDEELGATLEELLRRVLNGDYRH